MITGLLRAALKQRKRIYGKSEFADRKGDQQDAEDRNKNRGRSRASSEQAERPEIANT